ncbi:tetratricopeptide (TPR) repeat protein [Catenulispora sp. EB89]|uniref:CHAT domain-containing protein n=1 Tax=Catenulispora sp. EB89 TaxID=3156257 RepID=UPI003518C674
MRADVQERLASLNRRLEAYTRHGDVSAILADEALSEAKALMGSAGADAPDGGSVPLTVVSAVAWLHWNRALELSGKRGAGDRRIAADLFTAIAGVDPTQVPEQLRLADDAISKDLLPVVWADRAAKLLEQAQRLDDPPALDQAIGLLRRVVAAAPVDHPNRAGWLTNLSIAHRVRLKRLSDAADLEASVAAAQEAAATVRADDPFRAGVLSALGNALQSRFEFLDDIADIDAAVSVLQEAAALTAGHPKRGLYLTNLGLAHQARFERTDDPADIDAANRAHRSATAATGVADPSYGRRMSNLSASLQICAERYANTPDIEEAVTAGRAAVASAPADHPERPGFLSTLGTALAMRYGQSRDPADIDGAVTSHREAVTATPAGHQSLPILLSNYAEMLRFRFEQFNTVADLDLAVSALHEALEILPVDHPQRASMLSDLCRVLRARFDRLGAVADINDAVAVGRQVAAATAVDHPSLGTRLYVLAVALIARFELTGDTADIDEAITVGRRAVKAIAPDHARRPRALSCLSGALLTRFGRTGDVSDLDAAVATGRQAAAGAPRDATLQHNLSFALYVRFERDGELADIDAAVAAGRIAVAEAKADNPERPLYLSGLGTDLRTRFHRTGDPADLDEAITAHRESVESAAADHPDRALCLSMYDTALGDRFSVRGDIIDLHDAVAAGRAAIDLVGPDHQSRATYMFNLGSTLRTRFLVTGDPADIEAAIEVSRLAIAATPADHPYRGRFQYGAGLALHSRFLATGDASDARDALTLWRQATSVATAPIDVRIEAARAWGDLSATLGEWQAATDGYAEAVQLLPLLAWLGAGRRSREQLLSARDGLASDAAACAIAAGQPDRAVELLEQGRGVMWSQMLETRTELTALHEAHPELAASLDQVRAQLDGPAATAETWEVHSSVSNTAPTVDNRIEAARRWNALLDQARALPGFYDFARPPVVEQLRAAAADGTVAMINISRWRCDALLIKQDKVDIKSLPGLTREITVGCVNTYLGALQAFQLAGAEEGADRDAMEHATVSMLEWLWDAITGPVLDALGHRHLPASGQRWPRLWWCPTGPLTVVPLHAAGYHGKPGNRSVLDRVISSYTPTLRALANARTRPRSTLRGRLLLIALPDTPGALPLPAVEGEKAVLTSRFDDAELTLLEGAGATHAAVVRELAAHPWVHASCHGDQNLSDPTSGGLLPYDWRSAGAVSILDVAAAQHEGGEFAFLSACKSATGGVAAIDEAVNLAAALHYAGWRHVIGTLWSVWDADSARITKGVYQRLSKSTTQPAGVNGALSAAAEALHHTLREYRRRDRYDHEPSRWAPFLHIGP